MELQGAGSVFRAEDGCELGPFVARAPALLEREVLSPRRQVAVRRLEAAPAGRRVVPAAEGSSPELLGRRAGPRPRGPAARPVDGPTNYVVTRLLVSAQKRQNSHWKLLIDIGS